MINMVINEIEYRKRAKLLASAVKKLIKLKEDSQRESVGTSRLYRALELLEYEAKNGEIYNDEWYMYRANQNTDL